MNIVKARAAVEYLGKQLAQAMDAADNLAAKAHQAHLEATQTDLAAEAACETVQALKAEYEAAEAELAAAVVEFTSMNGAGSGAAYNATIRIDPNPESI